MKIWLLANDQVGAQVAACLRASGDDVTRLYLHAPAARKCEAEIRAAAGTPASRVHSAEEIRDPGHLAAVGGDAPDFIVTVYWAHLLKPAFFQLARDTVNFHPALLPINRGWFPHVHSILDGTPTGVTLHRIDASADTGPIWAQRRVPLRDTDSASDIYFRLQDEMVRLFAETWPQIKAGQLMPTPQDQAKAVYHRKDEIDALDLVDLEGTGRVQDFINRLRARTFGNRSFAYYLRDGKKYYLHLRVSESSETGK